MPKARFGALRGGLGKSTGMWERIPEQIRRLAVLLVVLIAGLFVLRYYVIPPSLIEPRLHRQSTIRREISKPIKFAGTVACATCHEDEGERKRASFHRDLACESCHGAAVTHTEDPFEVKPAAPRERKFCPLCHAYDPSRPTGFPQINPTLHNPLKACVMCHDPHDPTPPTVPRECSACHGEIWRTKALSPHALVGCTTCHEVPDEHKEHPRSVMAAKPETREFCATCHGEGSKQEGAPRVDLANHGQRYLCWECHYPHRPGGA